MFSPVTYHPLPDDAQPLINHPIAWCESSNLFQIHKCNCGPGTHGCDGLIFGGGGLIYATVRAQATDRVFRHHLIHPPSR